jgi:predicted site-specific integrase-resolvase
MQLVPIGVAAQGLGVHPDTLRRWEKEGKIDPPERTTANLEEDLAQDVIEIVTVFSARLYGSRSHKNREVMEELRSIASAVAS